MSKISYLTIFILLLLLISSCLLILPTQEYFNSIHFLSKQQTSQFFSSDKDNYIKDLTPLDIKAQKSISKKDYQTKIINSADNFTPEEKYRLTKACEKADNALRKINISGFDGKKAADLNWNISLTRGKVYEDGLPHTRLNTIFITDYILNNSDDLQLAKTMLHEKVHVYERLFPSDINIWINNNGYKKFKKWKDWKIARSNPDINDWSYLSPDGTPMVVLYKNKNPSNIHQIDYTYKNDPSGEHPYESLAYSLEEYLSNDN